jgi:Na+/proline symporter
LYLLVTIAIGLYAANARQEHRRLRDCRPQPAAGMVVATTFATWFGSETVLGIPAKFVSAGLGVVVEDPFGAGTMCLILVGLFFAAGSCTG